MRIDFRLVSLNEDEERIVDDFLESVVIDIRDDIISGITPAKMTRLGTDLLNAEWIEWNIKPLRIDMMSLVRLIVSKIGYSKRRNQSYTICINPMYIYPGTKTRLDTIARFLDRGTEDSPVTTFISKVFNNYSENIENLWDSYVRYRLNRRRTSKVVIS